MVFDKNRVLIICPCQESTGNRTTALRYRSIFEKLHFGSVFLVDPEAVEEESVLLELMREKHITVVVVVHVTKGAVVLDRVSVKVPIIIVLGGTDVNVDAHEQIDTFNNRVSRACAVVAFADSLFESAPKGAFPSHMHKHIIPQGFFLPLISTTTEGEKNSSSTSKAPNEHLLLPNPFFLLIAGIRPIKDVLYLSKVISQLRGSILESLVENTLSVPLYENMDDVIKNQLPSIVIVGPVLNESYASEVLTTVEASEGGLVLLPPQSQHDIQELAKQSLAVVNSSMSEGQSSALIEAMYLGVPVMARDIISNRRLFSLVHQASNPSTALETIGSFSSSSSIASLRTTSEENIAEEPSLKSAAIEESVLRDWELHSVGVLFSSAAGFLQAASAIFFNNDKLLKAQFENAVENARSGMVAQTVLEVQKWGDLFERVLTSTNTEQQVKRAKKL